jgi:excisionase family DNA binding protein
MPFPAESSVLWGQQTIFYGGLTMQEDRLSFSKDEVARQLGVSRDSVTRAIQRGEMKPIYFGRRVLIPRSELERLLRGTK